MRLISARPEQSHIPRAAALESIRLREFARGFNDAQTGRDHSVRADNALAYLAGFASGDRPEDSRHV
jgi:hypothetical protein